MFLSRALFTLGLLTVALPTWSGAALAQDAEGSFQEALQAYQAGNLDGAVEQLKAVLAENPSHEEAYRLWEQAERNVITRMLLERGELGRLAERFLGLATLGRQEAVADPEAAAEAVQRLLEGDEVAREQASLELRARFGSWAVPALVGPLGDRSSTENRVLAIQALVRLGGQAVQPLTQVLKSDDELTRRNAAAVLGTLRDRRAAAGLAVVALHDSDEVTKDAASDALAKIGVATRDPVSLAAQLADGYFRGDMDLTGTYGASSVVWDWKDGALVGRETLSGLAALEIAEGVARDALQHGGGATLRPILASIHAAQKGEILAAGRLAALEGNEFLAAAQARLPALEVDLALAGSHRGRALNNCLTKDRRQPLAAQALMESMGNSPEERTALSTALLDSDPGVAFGAALALARQGDTDARVVARLAGTLAATPERFVVSIGDTGLSGATVGWMLLASDGFDVGLLRAKSLPPKDVIVVQDGLHDLTLDTLVFAFKNDPRTAEVPLIVVTEDVAGVEALYGDKLAKVVRKASFADVQAAAGEPGAAQALALERARAAAVALTALPSGIVRIVGDLVTDALGATDDAGVRIAVLDLAGQAGIVEAVPAIEAFVLDDTLESAQRAAALRAAGRLWAMGAPPSHSAAELSTALIALATGSDEALRLPAAEALGQLKGVTDRDIAGSVQ
ncbi:MAG: HEAT repeat domain-containing protein [Planctomycetota bacterium]